MAINIKFDLAGNPEPPTILLANKNGNILGQLKFDEESIELTDRFNDISEFSFTVNKYVDDELVPLWDKIVNFKLVYCKEWDCWFEIKVELDEENNTTKTVFCTQLGQSELSQIMLYDIEINTEADIERDDYKIAILYDEDDPEASILHRLLKDKAPHYSIRYVDPSIRKIQRSFSFDGTSIHDALQEIAEEIGCLFIFDSNSDENGKIQRTISVYDLWHSCPDCGYRHESWGYFDSNSNIHLLDELENMLTDEIENYLLYKMQVECPKCSNKNIKRGYGEDTLIFVTSDDLASSGIQLVTDVDSVKNCFKLEAGDDLMTSTVRNCNPNGTDYIWRFSDDMKEDMSNELVKKIDSYNNMYERYCYEYESNIDTKLLGDYNSLVDKYSVYDEALQKIDSPIIGYPSLMNAYYNTIDLSLYLKSGLMPSVKMSETNALEQARRLTTSSLSPVAVADIKKVSLSTANSAVLAMAKIIVKSTFKVEIKTSELYSNNEKKYWKGKFTITNYSDEEDIAESNEVSVELSDDMETITKQKIDKILNKEDADDLSVTSLFEKEYDDFCNELKKYALNPLISFRDACQSCIDVLIEQGVTDESSWSDNEEGSDGNLYENLYLPYYNKLSAIEAEIKIREDEISIILGVYDNDNNLVSQGLQTCIEKCRAQIQDALDFQKHLGKNLWLEFCAYRREDKYSNENYISDGLDNAELFKRALEFFETAEKEIYKSSESQHSISTTLNNLLSIPKFKNLVNSFKTGNWIRVRIDDKVYKLRLLEYSIDFGDFNNIPVEFSDVTKIKNGISDVKSILSQASSIATSYSSTKRQASQGAKGNSVLNDWVESGLNTTKTKIVDSVDENLMFGKNAFWCRQYDPITNTYSDEQIKIVNSTIAITDDNWKTTKTAVGKYYYIDPDTKEIKTAYGVNGETIVGKLLIGENLNITNDNGSMRFDNENGFVVKNDINTITMNPSDDSIFNISSNDENIFTLNKEGKLSVVGNITASSLTLLDGTTVSTTNIAGLAKVATSGSYKDLSNVPEKLSEFENDKNFVSNDVDDLENYYNKTESDSLLSLKADTSEIDSLHIISKTGLLSDAEDMEEFKEWILEQIQTALNP